jgi:sporulation protein YlmC with PRC-barrel domain
MTDLPSVIRHSELLNRLVLNRDTLEELGRIEVLWMHPPLHRVLGFVCKLGFLGKRKLAFKLSQLDAIGDNGILTHSQPDETDGDRVRQLESLIQCEVWSESGSKMGKIVDCEFSLQTGAITDYLLIGDTGRNSIATRLNALTGTIYRLPPSKIASFGRTRVLVRESSIQAFALYRDGISQTFSKMGDAFKEESAQVADELRSLGKRAQQTTLNTTDQLKTLAEQAKERARLLAEQAKETAQNLAEQVQETGETLIEQLQDERSQMPSRTPSQSGIEDDFDFDFEEPVADPGTQPGQGSIQDPAQDPVQESSSKPAKPNGTAVPEPNIWQIDEEPWMQGSDRSAASFASADLDQDWDVDEDPWDITQPPEPTEPVWSPAPPSDPSAIGLEVEHTAIANPNDPSAASQPEPTEAEAVVQRLLDEISFQTLSESEQSAESDDQPWI